MSEEFIEENTTGEIIKFDKDDGVEYGEQEGIRRRKNTNIFKAIGNNIRKQFNNVKKTTQRIAEQGREQALRIIDQKRRAQREAERRRQAEIQRVRNMENQIRQLSARVSQLENIIRDKDRLIDRKNKHIAFLTSENTRLRKKVNSLLDNLQYYKTSVLGTDQVDGYKTTVVKQQLKIDELLQQEIGKPITATKDGFENIYEGFEYDFAKISGSGVAEGYRKNYGLMSVESTDYDSLKNEHIILEGFVDQQMTAYNAVFIENQTMQNHIDNTTNIYSINNQLTSNIIAKRNILEYVNFVLIILFFIVYLYGCYKVYTINGMENNVKIAICIVMLFIIFILHTIEYIIFTILPLFIAFLVKTPIRPYKYFNKPSIYDYIPKVSLPPPKR